MFILVFSCVVPSYLVLCCLALSRLDLPFTSKGTARNICSILQRPICNLSKRQWELWLLRNPLSALCPNTGICFMRIDGESWQISA
jgi:hypothetical protein